MKVEAPAVVRLQGISHRYGGVAAIDGITLDIPGGRMVGLIGPDGVGKSSRSSSYIPPCTMPKRAWR